MRIIFLISGSGTSAFYISKKFWNLYNVLHSSIINLGIIYECENGIDGGGGDSNINLHIVDYKTTFDRNAKFWNVMKEPTDNNEQYHKKIYDTIISDLKPDVIILVEWMHILPRLFIAMTTLRNIKIINLHYSLQYQIVGQDVCPKIWKMYEEGLISETGCMVHYVSCDIVRGALIHEIRLDLTKCNSYADYYKKMFHHELGLDKICLWEALMILEKNFNKEKNKIIDINHKTFSDVNGLTLKFRGKVRDVYESVYYSDYLFIIISDRISTNSKTITFIAPHKGNLLNKINTFWHKMLELPQMICYGNSNLMVVRKMYGIPLKIIVHRRITGSLWKDYSQHGLRTINGYELREGMLENDLFEEPIITYITKEKT